jgi:hypothetical protein
VPPDVYRIFSRDFSRELLPFACVLRSWRGFKWVNNNGVGGGGAAPLSLQPP